VIGLLVGGGALFAWRHNHPDAVEGGGNERRIAVLPFQNLGDSADAYFADGMTDAVRGKLTGLPTLQVIGSNSSGQYKATTKTPQEIGRELGVDYLLVGKVRWAKQAGGGSRVQVSPELIDTRTAVARWQQPFDASLTDVFQVQADIAAKVAQALDVELGSRQQQALAAQPTQNLAAYDLYLKGQAQAAAGSGAANQRQAVVYYEQAVALDSSFVPAWVALSYASGLLYSNGAPTPAVANRARAAAERAVALAPQDPGGYRALGSYYRAIKQFKPADEQLTKALAFRPDDPQVLRVLGLNEMSLGRWDAAVDHFRRALRLDPRTANIHDALGIALIWLRRLDEAQAAVDAAMALQPSSLSYLQDRVMIHLARGDLSGARTALAQPPAGADQPSLVSFMTDYWDLYWPLSDEQRALLTRLTPASFDGDAGVWGLGLAGVYEMQGDHRRAAAYADSARAGFEQQLLASPEDAQRRVLLGLSLAFMGRKAASLRELQRGIAAGRDDAEFHPYYEHQLVRAYILLGEPEQAIDLLEKLLKQPYYLTAAWLRIDPSFDPIRNNPRFKKLVEGTA
jgi:TolB-like protein/Tfp pilus assembly protein PilF